MIAVLGSVWCSFKFRGWPVEEMLEVLDCSIFDSNLYTGLVLYL